MGRGDPTFSGYRTIKYQVSTFKYTYHWALKGLERIAILWVSEISRRLWFQFSANNLAQKGSWDSGQLHVSIWLTGTWGIFMKLNHSPCYNVSLFNTTSSQSGVFSRLQCKKSMLQGQKNFIHKVVCYNAF